MEKKGAKGKIFSCALLAGLLLQCIAVVAAERRTEKQPEKQTAINERIQREKKELEKLKEEIEKKREKNLAARKREGSVLSQIERMDRQLRYSQKEATIIELKIKEKDQEMAELMTDVQGLSQDIQEKREIISKRLRNIYQDKRAGSLKILFASRDYPDLMRRIYYLQTVAHREGELLAQFKERQSQLLDKNDQLTQARLQLNRDKEELAQKLVEIRGGRKKKDQLLAKVQEERGFYEKALAELDESSLQLQGILKTLEEERKKVKSPSLDRFSKERGKLGWPNDGDVVALFGRQKHPKFDTYIYRKGIEIEPSKEDRVRAVFEGAVIYANWFRGYGMVIIIDHGENYYSIYAHLAKLLVSVGDRVGKNRTIGEVGETGLSQGNRLYFEIRHQGEPMDPLVWLQKKR